MSGKLCFDNYFKQKLITVLRSLRQATSFNKARLKKEIELLDLRLAMLTQELQRLTQETIKITLEVVIAVIKTSIVEKTELQK